MASYIFSLSMSLIYKYDFYFQCIKIAVRGNNIIEVKYERGNQNYAKFKSK